MKKLAQLGSAIILVAGAPFANAAIHLTVTQGEEFNLAASYSSEDLVQGLTATELPGDRGWHAANTDPADQLPAFTDGEGIRFTGLTGLLNDFPATGEPAKRIEYALPAPHDLTEIRVFTGNNGRDGRVFHTYTVSFSNDAGQSFSEPIYVQSHVSGTFNNSQNNNWHAVLSQLTDDAGLLARRVTHLRFDFYSVDNTAGQMRDPFGGTNPFTGSDDGLSAAFVSPLVWEIDVFGQPSPPHLSAQVAAGDLEIRWSSMESGFILQMRDDLAASDWLDVDPQPDTIAVGDASLMIVPMAAANRFYRLRK